MANIRLKGGFR